MSLPAVHGTSGGQRLQHVDALRGIAALVVGYFHMSLDAREQGLPMFPGEAPLIDLFTAMFDSGKIAVVTFFVISGFIVPVSLSRGGPAPVRRFLASRFFRLYPLYWFSVVLCVVFAVWPPNGYPLPLLLANATMLQGFMGFTDINGAAWTLQIEITFYALCLGLFLTGRLESSRAQLAAVVFFLCCALAMGMARFYLVKKLPVALPLSLAVMFFGCLWRGAVVDASAEARRMVRRALLAFAVLLPVTCGFAYSGNFGTETWHRYLVTYATSLGVFMLCTTYVRLTWRPLVALGTISYSVYLLHSPVWSVMTWTGLHHAPVPYITHLFIATTLAVTVLASIATYRWIELPAIALGRRIGDSRPKPRDAVAVITADNTM